MKSKNFSFSFPLDPPDMDGWSISHHQKILKTRKEIVLPADGFLGVYFNLGRSHKHKLPGYKESIIDKHQYNLISLPKNSVALTLPKGEHNSFCIHVTSEYLKKTAQKCAQDFPMLYEIIDAHEESIPLPISTLNFIATPEMIDLIQDVIDSKYRFSGLLYDMYTYSKVMVLLLTCLDHIRNELNANLEIKEIRKIRKAYNFINRNFNHQFSKSLLADYVQMDHVRFENAFKAYFRKTTDLAISEARSKKAKALLMETTLPVSKIAAIVGYTLSTKFTKEFKRNYGYPPRILRRRDP